MRRASNVKAGGHACPFLFRCVGCDHFRTDPSAFRTCRPTDTLLRERLAAADELDAWARAEATPSEEDQPPAAPDPQGRERPRPLLPTEHGRNPPSRHRLEREA
jgi:hypothetical protein